MKDLTDSSIAKNILQMALPIAAGMFFQTLYFLIDLYFVAGLGDDALAGVGAAGNVMFIVFAAWGLLGFGYPSTPILIALNVTSKILAFVVALSLFLPQQVPASTREDLEVAVPAGPARP